MNRARSRPPRRIRWTLAGLAGALVGALVGGPGSPGAAIAAELCAPRPGQPAPLPRIDDADEFRAHWATLRVEELSRNAQTLEASDPLIAHALWVRAACLTPGSAVVSKGVARTTPVRIHRPRVVRASTPMPRLGDPWASLDAPVVVVVRSEGPFIDLEQRSAARSVFLDEIDTLMSQVESSLRSARFAEALEVAGRTRTSLDEMRKDSDLPPRWARLEVLQATAELAMGRQGDARASMGRALKADPTLELDPATTSPKVIRVFESARGANGGPG